VAERGKEESFKRGLTTPLFLCLVGRGDKGISANQERGLKKPPLFLYLRLPD